MLSFFKTLFLGSAFAYDFTTKRVVFTGEIFNSESDIPKVFTSITNYRIENGKQCAYRSDRQHLHVL